VQSLFSNVVVLSAGGAFTLTLDGSGGVWGSGNNYFGNLGDGNKCHAGDAGQNAGSRD